jgi:starch synthase
LKIAFVTQEFQSLVRRTSLAEISEALPCALARDGHDIHVFMPHHKDLCLDEVTELTEVGTVTVPDGTEEITLGVRRGKFRELKLVLVEHPELFNNRHPYGDDDGPYEDNWRRFAVFSRGVLEALALVSFKPDILHCYDWTTGLIPVIRELEYVKQKPSHPASRAGVYFAINNLAMQGAFEREILPKIGMPASLFKNVDGLALDGRVNFLKAGAEFATIIGTHSAAQATRMQEIDRGYGLEDTFARRKKEIIGIANGIDYSAWDPASDKIIPATYSGESEAALAGKKRCKSFLQQTFLLDKGPRTPVVSIIGRFDVESGFHIVAEITTHMLERNFELIMMGQGQDDIIERVRSIEGTFSGRCRMIPGYHVDIAHQILAGSDIVILPSHYLPSVSLCAIAMRYGAIPMVYAHAGADDIVTDHATDPKNGNAFTFKTHTGEGLIEAIDHARGVYKNAADWTDLTMRSMAQDFSWERCAADYIKAYRRVTRRVRAQRDDQE